MGELSIIARAQERYASLPAVTQPHTLDGPTLEECGAVLLYGENANPQLAAVSCAVDYAHVLAAQGQRGPAKQMIDFAQHRNGLAVEQTRANYRDHQWYFKRAVGAQLNTVYLPYYANSESLPNNPPEKKPVFQRHAYAFVQKTVLNRLLLARPRPGMETNDQSDISYLMSKVVALQALNRLLMRRPDHCFTPIPANLREKQPSGPHQDTPTVETHSTFDIKLVFRDHTLLPLSVFAVQRPYRSPSRHPAVAEVCWKDADITTRDITWTGQVMRHEVAGDILTRQQQELINRVTGHVLRSVACIEPLGESVYGPRDPRTIQSLQAYEDLQALAKHYAA